MTRFPRMLACGATTLGLLLGAAVVAQEAKPTPNKTPGVWTDPSDTTLPVDFKLQGEYAGEVEGGGGKLGAQIIALGKGALHAVLYPGGLPGEGWDGKGKILLAGTIEGDKAALKAAEGKRKYLAQNPDEFSATSKFPPDGQKAYTAEVTGDALTGKTDDGKAFKLARVNRQSPTMGAKPPEGAKVLFDGTNKDAWKGGRLDEQTKFLNTDGNDVVSKDKFTNYTMHIEFMLAFRPDARGQGRGNSGFYQVDLYEVQVLDSFGLDGKNNECGGVYTKAEPKVNMCLTPLAWQTYDVDFKSAEAGPDGKKAKNARMTLRHNGVVIHDDIEINGKTGGAREEPEGTPGPIKLQGHGNPLQYRNIWVVEKK